MRPDKSCPLGDSNIPMLLYLVKGNPSCLQCLACREHQPPSWGAAPPVSCPGDAWDKVTGRKSRSTLWKDRNIVFNLRSHFHWQVAPHWLKKHCAVLLFLYSLQHASFRRKDPGLLYQAPASWTLKVVIRNAKAVQQPPWICLTILMCSVLV